MLIKEYDEYYCTAIMRKGVSGELLQNPVGVPELLALSEAGDGDTYEDGLELKNHHCLTAWKMSDLVERLTKSERKRDCEMNGRLRMNAKKPGIDRVHAVLERFEACTDGND